MRKLILALTLFALPLSGCGYDGYVRYPCQDFENWDKPECNPPRCEATGVCTKDLLPDMQEQEVIEEPSSCEVENNEP